MPTATNPVTRSICQLCGKEVAELPNGRLRYHSCQPQQRSTSDTTVKGSTPMPPAAPVAPPASEAPAAPPADEAPAEISMDGKTVEDATASKPKRAPKADQPKPEPKVPESILKARAERTALLERARPIVKLTGTGDKTRVALHSYDPEIDRTLCGATVLPNEEARKAQGWHDEIPESVAKAQKDAAVRCATCEARVAKLTAGGPIRRRVARKPGEAAVGDAIVKAGKGDEATVHLTNAATNDPVRTLCGAVVGTQDQGWVAPTDADVQIGCSTCRARRDKLTSEAETDEAMAEKPTS